MIFKKPFKLIIPITLAGLILAGCGHRPLHHATSTASHEATERTTHKASYHKSKNHVNAKLDKAEHSQATHSSNQSNAAKSNSVSTSSSASNTDAKDPSNSASANDSEKLPTVALGHGVVGYEDRGAGQIYVRFNVQGHTFTTHGNDVDEPSSTAVNDAKGIVNNLYNK